MIPRLALAVLVAATLLSSARAEEPWRVQLTPYAWVPGVSGSIRPASWTPTLHSDISAGDILKDLDGALFLTGTVRKGRFLLLGDFTWASLSTDGTVDLPLHLQLKASGKVSQLSFTLAAGYTIVERPTWLTIDLVAGVRVWRVRGSLDARLTGPLGLSVSKTKWWADPIIGMRARVYISRRWSLIAYADGGGFGAGSDSTWQVVGTLNFQALDHLYLSVGYRHMSVNYRSGGAILDFDMSGPLFGLTWRF